MTLKNFISMQETSIKDLHKILQTAYKLKQLNIKNKKFMPLVGKTLAMIFQKPSTRTRVSFEVGMYQLGGHALYINTENSQIGRGETIEDTARTLSRYVNAIMIRANKQTDVIKLAKYAGIPVINGLSDLTHPCQVLSDIFTIIEKKGWNINQDNTKKFNNIKLAYIGDGSNVANSLIVAASKFGMNITLACPKKYSPSSIVINSVKADAIKNNAKIEITTDPIKAVRNADFVYTDVWISMGLEKEKKQRLKELKPYQVNSKLISYAKSNAMIMHCLPAHRGEEITDEVLDSKNSIVFDQAENRLHVQKAILYLLLN